MVTVQRIVSRLLTGLDLPFRPYLSFRSPSHSAFPNPAKESGERSKLP